MHPLLPAAACEARVDGMAWRWLAPHMCTRVARLHACPLCCRPSLQASQSSLQPQPSAPGGLLRHLIGHGQAMVLLVGAQRLGKGPAQASGRSSRSTAGAGGQEPPNRDQASTGTHKELRSAVAHLVMTSGAPDRWPGPSMSAVLPGGKLGAAQCLLRRERGSSAIIHPASLQLRWPRQPNTLPPARHTANQPQTQTPALE